jgi:hypothetical protein
MSNIFVEALLVLLLINGVTAMFFILRKECSYCQKRKLFLKKDLIFSDIHDHNIVCRRCEKEMLNKL